MTTKILATSIFALLIAGCSNDGGSTASTTTGPTAAGRIPTSGAVRVAGDIVPGRLVAVSITTPAATDPVYWSGALQPKNPYTLEQPTQPVVGRDMHRIMKGSDPAAYVFPLDAPAGARVVVHPVNSNLPLPSVHLVDVATGTQLDLARDITPSSIDSRHTPVTPDLLTAQPKDGKLAPAPADVSGLIPLDPGWVQNVPKLRVLTFDKPAKPGLVRIVVPADIQTDGLWVEVAAAQHAHHPRGRRLRAEPHVRRHGRDHRQPADGQGPDQRRHGDGLPRAARSPATAPT